jgi:biotin synthase
MADVPRAPISRLRRIQLTKYLIEQHDLPRAAIEFDDAGAIARVRAPRALIETCVAGGIPFMTNGCPDRTGKVACNRPFGSYRPGEEFRDYPFAPTAEDIEAIRSQARFHEVAG